MPPPDPKLLSFQPLFYSPLTVFEVPHSAALNQQLMAEATAMRQLSEGVSVSNVDGWHSDFDLFDRKEPGCKLLCQHIRTSIEQTTRAVLPTFDFKSAKPKIEGWINILQPGGLNTPHEHPGWTWSGCYYVNVPVGDSELSGSIEFLDTRMDLHALGLSDAACFMGKYSIKPKAGMLLIFPSYLRHWVYPNKSGKERMSIAFNARYD